MERSEGLGVVPCAPPAGKFGEILILASSVKSAKLKKKNSPI